MEYFYAVVEECTGRGYRNTISMNDLEPLLKEVEGKPGTPITEELAREYRRLMLLKDP